jgi:hypothetical protein
MYNDVDRPAGRSFQEQTPNEIRSTAWSSASPFAYAAPGLLRRGYSAIPLASRRKYPGTYKGPASPRDVERGYAAEIGAPAYAPMLDWTAKTRASVPDYIRKNWLRWPDANVGILMGAPSGNVFAIDFDCKDDTPVAAQAARIVRDFAGPETPERVGAKGFMVYAGFDPADPVVNAVYLGADGKVVLEIKSTGTQVVMPPSIHPDTGLAYQWVSARTLADVEPDELQQRSNADLAAMIEKLRAIGFIVEKGTAKTATDDEGSPAGRNWLTGFALADLDSWVPALGLANLERKSGGYAATAHWRAGGTGRPLHERKRNLHVDAKGCRDFGDGKAYSPVGLVAAALYIEFAAAADWLFDRLRAQINEALPPWQPRPRAVEAHPAGAVAPVEHDVDAHEVMWPSAAELQAERASAAADEPVDPVEPVELVEPWQPENEVDASTEAVALVGEPDLGALYPEPSHAQRLAEIEAEAHKAADENVAIGHLGEVTLAEARRHVAEYFDETIAGMARDAVERLIEIDAIDERIAELKKGKAGIEHHGVPDDPAPSVTLPRQRIEKRLRKLLMTMFPSANPARRQRRKGAEVKALDDALAVVRQAASERRADAEERSAVYMAMLRGFNADLRTIEELERRRAELEHQTELALVELQTGVGKSRDAKRIAASNRSIYAVATIEAAEEVARDIGEGAAVLYAWDSTDADDKARCVKAEEGRKLQAAGIAWDSMCGTCKHAPACALLASRLAAAKADALVTTHARLLHPAEKRFTEGRSQVFIDEELSAVHQNSLIVTVEDLERGCGWPLRDEHAETLRTVADFARTEAALGRDEAIELARRETRAKEPKLWTLGVRARALAAMVHRERRALLSISKAVQGAQSRIGRDRASGKAVEQWQLDSLAAAQKLREIAEALLSASGGIKGSARRAGRVAFICDNGQVKLEIRRVGRVHHSWVAGRALVHMDATMSPAAADVLRFTGHSGQTVRPKVRHMPRMRVGWAETVRHVHVTGAPVTKSKLNLNSEGGALRAGRADKQDVDRGKRNRAELVAAIRYCASQCAPGRLVVVGTKAHCAMLKKKVPANVDLIHWERSVGSNAWENATGMITLGSAAGLKPHDMRAWLGQRIGEEPRIEADGPRLYFVGEADKWAKHRQDRALVQAWGRLRPLAEKPVAQSIYHFGDRMPPDHKPDEGMTWSKMVGLAHQLDDVEHIKALKVLAIPQRYTDARTLGLTGDMSAERWEKAWGTMGMTPPPSPKVDPTPIYTLGLGPPVIPIDRAAYRTEKSGPFADVLLMGDRAESIAWMAAGLGQPVELAPDEDDLATHAVLPLSRRGLMAAMAIGRPTATALVARLESADGRHVVKVRTATAKQALRFSIANGTTAEVVRHALAGLGIEPVRIEGLVAVAPPVAPDAKAADEAEARGEQPASDAEIAEIDVDLDLAFAADVDLDVAVEIAAIDPLVAAFATVLRGMDPATRELHLHNLDDGRRALIVAAIAAGAG